MKRELRVEKQNIKRKKKGRLVHGLYVQLDIRTIDGRTRLGKSINSLKSALRDYVGEPSPPADLLIHRIAYKCIKLSLYESTNLNDLKLEEANHYLPMANSLRLDLAELAKFAGKGKPPDLEDYLNKTYRSQNGD